MFKLLTEEERQKVMYEYTIRRTIVMLFAFILVLVVGIIGLLPSYALSNARQNEVLERTRMMGSSGERRNEAELQAWLVDINRKLQALSPKLDGEQPSDFIERLLDQRTTGLRITGFSLSRVEDKITLSASGIALDRQTLITFENRINSSGYFSEVILPISNLAKDRNIDFQIKFSPASSTLPTPTP